MNNASRRTTSIFVACMLVIAQLAVSAYACPMVAPPTDSAAVTTSMPDCPEVEAINLCTEHCDYGSSSVDTHAIALPLLAPTALAWRIVIVAPPHGMPVMPDWRLERTTYPPPPILFGALRI